jgi:hypothetical protein
VHQRLGGGFRSRANSHPSIGEIDHTSLIRGVLLATAQEPMTDTFIHLVPIKDQSSGLFMMLLVMGGKTANNPFTLGPQTCYSREI